MISTMPYGEPVCGPRSQATSPPTITVSRALALLDALGASTERLNLTQLAQRTQLSKSTAFRLLNTLRAAGMVDRRGSTYVLGDRLLLLARRASEPMQRVRRDQLRETAMPFLQAAYAKTDSTVHLAVLDQHQVLYIEKLFGHRRVVTPSRVGAHFPLHASAVGKALMAQSDDSVIDAALTDANPLTQHTICDAETMYRELAVVRRAGYAIERDEAQVGLSCTAVPVRNHLGLVAALSLSTETARFHQTELVGVARHAARSIERALLASDIGTAV